MSNTNIMDKIINKGVPISTPITLRYCDLYGICNDKIKFETTIDNATKRRNEKLSEIVDMKDLQIYRSLGIKINPETLKKELVFSSIAFLSSILKYLNYNNINYIENEDDFLFDYTNLDFEVLRPRVKRLRQINDTHKLKKEFPLLYERYTKAQDAYKKIKTLEDKINKSRLDKKSKEKMKQDIINQLREKAEVCFGNIFDEARNFSVKKFCMSYAETFEKIIDKSDEICELLDEETISLDDISLDKEKLELYLAYCFIDKIRDDIDKDKQKYVYYLANYYKENPERKNSTTPIIEIPDFDGLNPKKGIKVKETVSPQSIYQEFRKFIIDNPTIQLLDFNDVDFSKMTLPEVEVFIEEYLKTFKANWEIIPKDHKPEDVIGPNQANNRVIDYERLNELFMEKKEFYSSLDPFMCIKGKKTFAGYIGYIFTNGLVVLDKFYDNPKKGKVSKGDAIYYMDVQDFYELSRYPKKELMKNEKVKRVIHRGNWQDEIMRVINKTGDGMQTSEEMKKLIYKKEVEEE